MEYDVVAKLAASLRGGTLPPSDPRDLSSAVRSIADGIARPETGVDELRRAMKALNDQRQFDHTRTLGNAWDGSQRPFDATVSKLHSQALIDLFELDRAERLLKAAIESASAATSAQAAGEIPEFIGLLGRIEKQRFVLTNDSDRLIGATDRYLQQLDDEQATDAWFWHAINAVALAARERRAGIVAAARKARVPTADEVYARMLELYEDTPNNPWVSATASEACLALRKCDDAELWLYRFLHHPEVRPFHIQSYDRQIREIWEGDPNGGGGRCADRLARIMARHLMRTQSQLTFSIRALPALERVVADAEGEAGLEKNFLGESTFSLANLKDMIGACASIGCVTNKTGARLGTGFLIDGQWLCGDGASPMFVTNAHVISDAVTNAIASKDALITFEVESERAGKPIYYRVGKVVFSRPPAKLSAATEESLDVTIVTLVPVTESTMPLVALKAAAALPMIENRARAYVVGHPMGGGLQVSMHDSLLLDVDDAQRLVHYRTPTDPGSSGSPLFNSQWQVIGLHHGGSPKTPKLRGGGDYEANEAISLLSIRQGVSQSR